MSHYGIYKTSIKCANPEIAKRAIALVAKKYGVEASESIRTFYKSEKVLAGFNTAKIPYGIGVRIQNNRLVIVGDRWKYREFDKVRKEIEDRYKDIVFNKELNKLGYSVKVTENEQTQEIVLKGVRE